ncbi:CGNR zinc finger domain-containing protein [Microbispora sp. NPDC049633]|uniref:CGNR zinc finger domain-containing protein n=1 Tax=Microbispora sp. NPDC049633 TaxID=3154355 RepID=UPI00341BB16F
MGTAPAMVVGVGQGARLGACQATTCSPVFYDTTRDASRRFCDLSCQNPPRPAPTGRGAVRDPGGHLAGSSSPTSSASMMW